MWAVEIERKLDEGEASEYAVGLKIIHTNAFRLDNTVFLSMMESAWQKNNLNLLTNFDN
jgi:hypothetical protein